MRTKRPNKDDCERAIRRLCGQWASLYGIPHTPEDQPSFTDFKSWMAENGYSRFLDFRSVTGSDYEAERWFDQQFKPMLRH